MDPEDDVVDDRGFAAGINWVQLEAKVRAKQQAKASPVAARALLRTCG